MYESHFGFTSRPFTATPNADLFFPTTSTRQAFESIASCVERASGAALVVGPSGIGKSVFIQALGKHFQQDFSVAILESASVTSRKELLQNILFELGLPFHGMEEGELRLTLMDYLKPSERCPNGLLLCVDEAHMLQSALLEELRMITNLVREGKPRARLVMAGNQSIEERLADPKLESLNQRISIRAYLETMNASECRKYVEDHLNAVGKTLADVFDDDAVEAVHIATNGIPRLVNQVCDHAFVLALADGKTRISQTVINEAWSDIQRLPVEWHVLGAQTEQPNEHVIEFGELGSEDSVATNDSDTGQRDSETLTVVNDDNSGGTEEPKEEETKEFVLDGPTNPFDEQFEQEEKVIDKFSQIIGHSPQQPQFPNSIISDPVMVDMNLDSEQEEPQRTQTSVAGDLEPSIDSKGCDLPDCELNDCNGEHGNSNELRESDTVDVEQSETELLEPETQALEHSDVGESTPEEIESEKESATSTLENYLASSTDAITFGVGQGIYADSFTPISDTDEQPEGDSSEVSEARESSNQEVQVETNLQGDTNAGTETTFDFKKQPLEEEISQTVEEIKNFVNDQNSESGRANDTDDRDMIIVQEDTAEDQASAEKSETDTVPMKDAKTGESTSQVKREDYQQLFDRLRNG